MILPFALDRLPELLGEWLSHRRRWQPVGARVDVRIDESGDPGWFNKVYSGQIVSSERDRSGRIVRMTIRLDRPIDYRGEVTRSGIAEVTAVPHFLHHGGERLLVTSANVALLQGADDRPIALATMRLG